MRIAAFARGLSAKPTGRGTVAREILQAMRRVRPDIEIHLFSAEHPGWKGIHWSPASSSNLVLDAWLVSRGIAQQVSEIRPDVFWSASHFLPRRLPKDLLKVVTLLDVVWRDQPETMRPLNRYASHWLERGLYHADRIVCISGFTRDRLSTHWPPLASRTNVVLLAPNSNLWGDTINPPGFPYLLNVDTLEPRKNLGILLDVLQHLPDLRLIQCGGIGWGVDELIERANATPNVNMRGYVSDSELGSLYRNALVAVFPSIYEGFHLPPLDAMSLGCPVIASDIPIHREVLGDAALLVDCHNATAWVAAINVVRNDAGRRATMIAAGRERARTFSWDDSAHALLRVFESIA